MDEFLVEGGCKIKGEVDAGGAKNSALALLFATLLADDEVLLSNVPNLSDIVTTRKILEGTGMKCTYNERTHEFSADGRKVSSTEAPYDLVRTMRASVLALGPLLTRFGKAKVSLPGGCAIGARPVNLHLEALKTMGAKIDIEEGYIVAETNKLKGAEIKFPIVSVGATENTMMAAVLASGTTIIRNAAREPEIVDLAQLLRAMGAKISGEGTSDIRIDGVAKLHGAKFGVVADRIEGGTLLASAAISGGEILVRKIQPELLNSVLSTFEKMGCEVKRGKNDIFLRGPGAKGKEIVAVDIDTEPFPGFPTDMQAQFMATLTLARGDSKIQENIFENRFMHVPELSRLGAEIEIQGNSCIVKGLAGKNRGLKGATVMATDLRASACLVLAGLVAEGKTTVRRIYHLDRGYEQLEKKLAKLGASITRKSES